MQKLMRSDWMSKLVPS